MEFLQLRTQIASQLALFHPQLRKTLLRNLAELVTATALARHVHLAKIGDELPLDTSHEARIQWVRRQLANDSEDTLSLFAPVVQALVAGWAGRSVRLILDPTDLSADLCIVQVALAYRGRALPIAWMTVQIQPGAVKAALEHLFTTIQGWLPVGTHVYLIADREFHGHNVLETIEQRGWIPVVRSKGRIAVELADGWMGRLADLAPAAGQQAFYQKVWLTAWGWGPYSLSLSNVPQAKRGKKKEDPWYIISTDPAGPQVLSLYAVRGWVDQMFRDLKGQGFHLDKTRLEDPKRLDRLMLVLALIYWWLLELGIWVDRMGLRRRVDRAKQPKCSLFMIGLRWFKRMLRLDTMPNVRLVPVL
jgi:hypothetical protein